MSSSFGSPTLWKKISSFCLRNVRTLPSLKHLLLAGAPVPKDLVRDLKKVLTDGQAFTPYGATESLPVTLVSDDEILSCDETPSIGQEIGTFVGKPVTDLRVIETSDQPFLSIERTKECGVGEVGEIIVRAKNVSPNYFARPDADRMGKIPDPQGQWHRMGDMGYLDSQGNLYFCGRKAHRIVWEDKSYLSVPIERIFNRHPKVSRSALVALADGAPAIVIEPSGMTYPLSGETKRVFIEELKELCKDESICDGIDQFFFHPSFPVDRRHNAKIYRDKLGEWARKELESK